MRIGIVAPPWIPVPPSGYGGIEGVVDSLAREFTMAGHDVRLVGAEGSTCPVERIPGVPARKLTVLGANVDELAHAVLAHEALSDVDIIHDHTLAGPLSRHRPPGIPLVTTAHGPLTGAFRTLYRAIALHAPLIAISRHQAVTAPEVAVRQVIHHGIDASTVPVGGGDGGYACFLGRMHPDKGLQQAIEIAREADIPLRIAARMLGACECEYFDSVIKPLIQPPVEFLGELSTAEKYELLGGAVALLNPIQWPEPFGMVMIEAMATGTPVIATLRGSAPEIVEDGTTGFLRSGNRQLAAALQQAGTLDRARCRQVTETYFSAARMAEEHLRLFADVAGRRVRGSASPVGAA
ncbi:group 1 glycosyl transferase [Arthrobacter crystallopoietes BAB-32]|uniref:Group 1 glycosyl transferase n=1 Tax=Arthrobacter crystallopoietes BAB-32 TaxID=1246476 RepID=N1V2P9_9MICC|nr:glycosyltransferase family 4 protein [Arthrobacter crystallopoietes]EMY34322.1 group 1 glycosyl transferase [Arthrobacter crystallopoietes BAB-32]